MDMEHFGTAKVVKALVECTEQLREALSGAQMAKDERLFGEIYTKQTELYDMIAKLVKTKEERANAPC